MLYSLKKKVIVKSKQAQKDSKKGRKKKSISERSLSARPYIPYIPREKLPSEDTIWNGTYPRVRL